MSDTEAKQKAVSRSVWYGVVDGMHRLLSITELIEENPSCWCGFSWPVTVTKGGHDFASPQEIGKAAESKAL